MQLDNPLPFIWLLILALSGSIVWALVRVREPGGPFSFFALFSVFFALGFTFRGVDLATGGVHHLRRAFDIGSPGFAELMVLSLVLAQAGFLAVVLGHLLGPRRQLLGPQLDKATRRLFGHRPAFWGVIATFSIICVVGLTLAFVRRGNEFYPHVLVNFGAIAALLLAISWFTTPEDRRWTLVAWSGIALVLSAYGILAGMKVTLVVLALPLLLGYHFTRRRLHWPHLVLGLVLFAATFPFFYAVRNVGFSARLPDEVRSYYDPARIAAPFLGREYSLDSTMLAVEYIRNGHSYFYFSSLQDLPTFFVPRAIWPDKPVSFALVFNRQVAVQGVFQPTTFLSPSLTGELYLDGGLPAVLLGCLGLGLLQRTLERSLLRDGQPTAFGLALYSLLIVHMTQFAEGPIATHIEFALIDIATMLVAVGLAVGVSRVSRSLETRNISSVGRLDTST